jgi:hypothetical protein
MTSPTKVVKPFFERYINRASVESTVLAGALFNVMPRSGQVRINNSKNIFIKNHLLTKKIDRRSTP